MRKKSLVKEPSDAESNISHLSKCSYFSLATLATDCCCQLLSHNPSHCPPPLATSYRNNKSVICVLWPTLTSDIRSKGNRSFPEANRRREAKWLWFITLMQICLLAQGVFLCQLLRHKPKMRFISLFKQEGLAILQESTANNSLPCCCY